MKKLYFIFPLLLFASCAPLSMRAIQFPYSVCSTDKYDIISAFPSSPGYNGNIVTNYGAMVLNASRLSARVINRLEATNFVRSVCAANNYVVLFGRYFNSNDGTNFIMFYFAGKNSFVKIASKNIPYTIIQSVAINNNSELYVYGLDNERGIIQFTINIAAETIEETGAMQFPALHAFCAGSLCFVAADYEKGIIIKNPITGAEYVVATNFSSVCASGETLFIFAPDNTILAYNITEQPQLTAKSKILPADAGRITGIAASGHTLYAAAENNAVYVFSIKNPQSIALSKKIKLTFKPSGIFAHRNCYIVTMYNGIYICR